MVFNVTKCKSVLLSRKQNVTTPTLTLDGCPLDFVREYKYLGILISTDLSWKRHIEGICVKVNKLVGMLYWKFSLCANPYIMARLYLSQIRPHLEYGVQVWHPHLATDTAALEKVQKFALRICSRNWCSTDGDLLEMFKLESLEHRRIHLSLCRFSKIINGHVTYPPNHLPNRYFPSRCTHTLQYCIPPARTNHLKCSFMPRTIAVWNNLPADCVSCSSYSAFKKYTYIQLLLM